MSAISAAPTGGAPTSFPFAEPVLRETDAVVAIGYGFRDKAINARLIGWWNADLGHRLIVVHGRVDDLVENARPAVADKWAGLLTDGRLRVVERWVADATWSEIAIEIG